MQLKAFLGTYEGQVLIVEQEGRNLRLKGRVKGAGGSVRTVAISDSGVVYAGGYEGNIKCLDLRKGLDLGEIQSTKQCVTTAVCHEDSLLSGGLDGVIYKYRGLEQTKVIPSHKRGINHLSCQGSVLVSSGRDSKIKFWDLSTLVHVRTVKLDFEPVMTVLSEDLKQAYILGAEGMYILNCQDESCSLALQGKFQVVAPGPVLAGVDGNLYFRGGEIVDTGFKCRAKVLTTHGNLTLIGSAKGSLKLIKGRQQVAAGQLGQFLISGAMTQTEMQGAVEREGRRKKISKGRSQNKK